MNRTVGYIETVGFKCLEDLREVNPYEVISALKLDYVGKETCVSGWKFGPYTRDSNVMHIVLKGKGTYTVHGKTFNLSAGDAFLIKPNVETVYQADIDDPWTYMWVGYHGFRAENVNAYMGFTDDVPVIKVKQIDVCQECIDSILEAKQLTFINEMKRLSGLIRLFTAVMEDNSGTNTADSKDYPSNIYAKAAEDYLMANYNKKLKIDDVAEHIGISRSHLTTSFRKEMGMSPKEYLTNFRLEKAADMLKSTGDTITVVALACGYDDSLSFSKAFKQKFGVSPKAYRASEVTMDSVNKRGSYEVKNHK